MAQIIIGGLPFLTKEKAIAHCRSILYRDEMDTEITGSDAVFVEAVLAARSDKLEEIGSRPVARYLRKVHRHNTPCFFAELADGALVDFSFMKVINAS